MLEEQDLPCTCVTTQNKVNIVMITELLLSNSSALTRWLHTQGECSLSCSSQSNHTKILQDRLTKHWLPGDDTYLSIPDHDAAIPRAGVDKAIPTPLDTGDRSGMARQSEEAAPCVGIPYFCSAILGGCHKAAAGKLHVGWLPCNGHYHLGMTCKTTIVMKFIIKKYIFA